MPQHWDVSRKSLHIYSNIYDTLKFSSAVVWMSSFKIHMLKPKSPVWWYLNMGSLGDN